MPGVTEKQILAARQMTAIEFLQRYRPEELVKAGSRGEFQLRTHDSFKINLLLKNERTHYFREQISTQCRHQDFLLT